LAGYIPRGHTRPKTAIRPSTNRARRRVTSFIRRTTLTSMPRRQPNRRPTPVWMGDAYGSLVRCMQEDHGSVGCSTDVLAHLDRKCTGRHTCHLPIPDATLHSMQTCPRELIPYLEASYECLPGKSCLKPEFLPAKVIRWFFRIYLRLGDGLVYVFKH